MAICGAKTKKGKGPPCNKDAMPNGKCRWHGGASTGPPSGNQNASKHGFYRSVITDDEHTGSESATLTDAVRMAYIQHRRLLEYMARQDELYDSMDLEQRIAYDKEKMRNQDLADKALGRIAQLEKTRSEVSGGPVEEVDQDEAYL